MSESDEMKKSMLHVYVGKALPLEKALAAYQGTLSVERPPAVALIYATNRCCFARLQKGGGLLDEDNKPLDLNSVYEARVFGEKAELRWQHTESGDGDAALLTEEEQVSLNWKLEEPTLVAGTIMQKYLLWGESLPGQSKGDWIKMATPRVGHYFAPVEHDGGTKSRVQLNACEYLRRDEKHGNVFVFEERWLGLTTVTAETKETKGANNG